MNVDSSGAQANSYSGQVCLSADGSRVAFISRATNLVPGDTNGKYDMFVYDVPRGATTRVSVDSAGAQGNGECISLGISADGRHVAFGSLSTNLVPGDTNGKYDVFVHDTLTGATSIVSLDSAGAQGNGHSTFPALSADGRYVAFQSSATNFVPGDTNLHDDIFVRDRQTGTTARVSVSSTGSQANFDGIYASLSDDGRYVEFESQANNLVPGDATFDSDIFVHDRQTGITNRVSIDDFGAEGNGDSTRASISADGRFVAFSSNAPNLVPGDTNGVVDVFAYDRVRGVIERVSVHSAGAQGNLESGSFAHAAISADGRFVAFDSLASNLVAGDTNANYDVFVHDGLTGTTTRISVDTANGQGNDRSYNQAISADGRFVGFDSMSTNLVAGDTNVTWDVFLRDRGDPPIVALCFGDGNEAPCPCGNSGLAGHGCENSSSTGGAVLTYSGTSSLSADSLVLTAAGEKPTALSIFLQGSVFISPVNYGDGLRCIGGGLKRLYTKSAVGGIVTAPEGGDPSISVRSAAAGDPISFGATRHYQTYYRDPVPGFCSAPPGNTWNIGNSLSAVWGP